MLLSIVMMVKNEEKYLDKTLNALHDLRKNIDTDYFEFGSVGFFD